MKKKIIVMLILVVAITSLSFTQQRNPRYLNRQNYIPFEISTPIAINGKIVKVDFIENQGRYGFGIHLIVDQKGKAYDVSVGPKFYLEAQNWLFKKGEKVTIKAFRGVEESKGLFFASEVIRDGEKLILRDKDGFSMWRRSLQRRPGGFAAYWGRGNGGYGYGAYGRGAYGRRGNRGYGYGAYGRGAYSGRGYGRNSGRGGSWVRGWRCWWYIPNQDSQ